MINDNYKFLKSNEQQSTESENQKEQIPEFVIDAIVCIVRVTLLVGFVLGAMCMGIIDRVVN